MNLVIKYFRISEDASLTVLKDELPDEYERQRHGKRYF